MIDPIYNVDKRKNRLDERIIAIRNARKLLEELEGIVDQYKPPIRQLVIKASFTSDSKMDGITNVIKSKIKRMRGNEAKLQKLLDEHEAD